MSDEFPDKVYLFPDDGYDAPVENAIGQVAVKYIRADLCPAQSVDAELEGWFIPLESMSSLAQETFANMMSIIKHGGQVDVVARKDGQEFRWECDGLKYAKMYKHKAMTELLEALKGVVRVADRKTVEFDAARAAIARAEGRG